MDARVHVYPDDPVDPVDSTISLHCRTTHTVTTPTYGANVDVNPAYAIAVVCSRSSTPPHAVVELLHHRPQRQIVLAELVCFVNALHGRECSVVD